jgi:hypothetical protein
MQRLMPGNNTDCQQLRGSNTAVPSREPVCLPNIDCSLTGPLTASIVPKAPAIRVLVPLDTELEAKYQDAMTKVGL